MTVETSPTILQITDTNAIAQWPQSEKNSLLSKNRNASLPH